MLCIKSCCQMPDTYRKDDEIGALSSRVQHTQSLRNGLVGGLHRVLLLQATGARRSDLEATHDGPLRYIHLHLGTDDNDMREIVFYQEVPRHPGLGTLALRMRRKQQAQHRQCRAGTHDQSIPWRLKSAVQGNCACR